MSKRPRVLIASQPWEGGVPRHVLELVAGLTNRYRITVACPRRSELWNGLQRDRPLRLSTIAAQRGPSLADVGTLIKLIALVPQSDLVHGHSSKAGFLVRLAAACTGRRRRCLFTPHGWSWWAFSGRRARVYLALERWAARWCRTILTVSEFERDAALRAGVGTSAQYRVVRNGVALETYARPPDPVRRRIIMVGRLAPPKRHDLAVRALAVVRERLPGATLDIVGDGPARPQIESLLRALRLGDAVRLLGQRNDVPELLSHAACLLLASDYEGCPLTVLEGMAAGLPVVATTFGGITELVDDGRTGRIAAAEVAPLAGALVAVLEDPMRARAMGDEARQEARTRFGHEHMIEGIEAAYREALAG
jgi:glycosyltransferase involved in cell wall biosynthesis